MNWADAKTFIGQSVAFSDDALHVIAGVAIQLAAALLLRVSIARLGPWGIVLLCEILNEMIDLLVARPSLAMQLGESGKDLLLTMAIPTLLLVIARMQPQILGGAKRGTGDCDPADDHAPDSSG